MNTLVYVLGAVSVIIALYYGQKEWKRWENISHVNKIMYSMETLDEIKEHAKEFNQKEVVKVTESIYVALGYALANSILICGPEGLVIVDVTESVEAAREILSEFRKITQKPITDIIYTHNHADHTYGAKAFVEDPSKPPNVWAHASMMKALALNFKGTNVAHYVRSMRQFGVFLPEVSAGIGFKLRFGKNEHTVGMIYPNKLIEGIGANLTLSGIKMHIIHIPGETDDQIGVWLPDQKIFLCADDLYRAFPNLYAIRGTKSRELMQWVESLDIIIALEPEILVPSHTRPVIGQTKVMKLLIEYRDAIQFVHDQTVRLINYGYHPDEISVMIQLPKTLLGNPYLKEIYGTLKWSAKSVFTDYLGWFSGDPVELNPLTRSEKANRMLELVGIDKLLDTARKALNNQDFQWALELAAHVKLVEPDNAAARDIKVEAMTALASRQTSVNGRNYYLTCAMEEVTDLKLSTPKEARESLVIEFPIAYTFLAFSTLFRPEDCGERNETLYVEITEPDSKFHIQLRNGVAIVRNTTPKIWNIKLTSKESIWKDILVHRRNALLSIASGDILVDGGALALKSFLDCFDRNVQFVK